MKTKSLNRISLLISLVATPLAFAADPAVEKPKVEGKTQAGATVVLTTPAPAPGTLTAKINDSVTFSTLSKALVAAELDGVLADKKGVYTIFAPTDEAFGKLPAGTLDKLMLPKNKEKLRSLLLYHVIAGKILAADMKDEKVTTMNGEKAEIDVDGANIEIDDTKVFSTDVMATNGVMHSIGKVIVPKSLDGFAKLDD